MSGEGAFLFLSVRPLCPPLPSSLGFQVSPTDAPAYVPFGKEGKEGKELVGGLLFFFLKNRKGAFGIEFRRGAELNAGVFGERKGVF